MNPSKHRKLMQGSYQRVLHRKGMWDVGCGIADCGLGIADCGLGIGDFRLPIADCACLTAIAGRDFRLLIVDC
jgi:hypothetical protein